MSVETDLLTTIYERLTGADAHGQALTYDGSEIDTYTGNAPTDASDPHVVIGRPRTRGSKFLDGKKRNVVRQQLRVCTSFPPGKGDHFEAYQIAGEVRSLLEAAPLEVQGKEPHIPNPDKQPIPGHDIGDEEALDLSVNYTFHL